MSNEFFMSSSSLWRAVRKHYPEANPTSQPTWVADDVGHIIGARFQTDLGDIDLSMAQVAQEWKEWVQRYRPYDYELVVTGEGPIVRNRATGETYRTTLKGCDCGSYKSQVENIDLIRTVLPDYEPVCKHMRWRWEAAHYGDGTVLLYQMEPERDQLTTWVWPGAEPIQSAHNGEVIQPGRIGLYWIGKCSHLPTVQARCLHKGWALEEWHPYGVPCVR